VGNGYVHHTPEDVHNNQLGLVMGPMVGVDCVRSFGPGTGGGSGAAPVDVSAS
jgi:hypothetical protein